MRVFLSVVGVTNAAAALIAAYVEKDFAKATFHLVLAVAVLSEARA